MDFATKNNFVVKHASVTYFEEDKKLFTKVFPSSPLIPDLAKVNQFNKKHLDERMLLELLNNVCPETILENRGIAIPAGTTPIDKEVEAQKELLNAASLNDIDYLRKKEIVKALGLKAKSQKHDAIDEALKAYIKVLSPTPHETQTPAPTTDPAPEATIPEANEPIEEAKEDKKKQGLE